MAKNKRRISSGEVFDAARETAKVEQYWVSPERSSARKPSKNYKYVDELIYLQIELIKMQEWVKRNGLKICVIFEGRDAAGKGGVIKRITDPLNPRICRVVALSTPTEKGTRAMVFSALRAGIARGWGDRLIRPQLVQPCRC